MTQNQFLIQSLNILQFTANTKQWKRFETGEGLRIDHYLDSGWEAPQFLDNIKDYLSYAGMLPGVKP